MIKLLLLSILFLFFAIKLPISSFAQEVDMNGGEIVIASPTPLITTTPTPNYVMPYPGLLPDSPLYFLKALRDRVISIMIGDPLKKAEFDILQTDKRIGAAIVLFESGEREKQELAISTVSKGLNYFEEAIAKAEEAKKQGHGITDIKSHMKKATTMYIYMLEKEEKKLPKPIWEQLEHQIRRLQQLTKKSKSL